jgi:hypothetical protein
MSNEDLQEALARISVIMELLHAAGETGRAAAIADLEASIVFWQEREGCGFVVDEKRRAIEIIRNRTTTTDDALTHLK